MKTLARMLMFLCPLVLLASLDAPLTAQASQKTTAPGPLFQTIAALDTAFFDAYNRCDLQKLGDMVTDDLEFYHDKTGLAVGKQIFLESIQRNICGKVHRDLVAGSLEVYPLHDYGAVEIGVHRFRHPGSDDAGEAKFVTLWKHSGGTWKVARVISYDHAPVAK